ncbi:MAG: hypothetical protein ABJA67_14200 [Chthonomonadales bacterium]
MNNLEREELRRLKESVNELAIQVARLTTAVEPLLRLQEEQVALRERMSGLEGFRAAAVWLCGLSGLAAGLRALITVWNGGR